ncbi:MAG: class I SAM-dependent DNA methyltransferase [Armatimonadetes bacterium]|nr:class I SAM-dependent DNA methyltransferase [Armatimonadota bacterium]
MPLSWNEIKTRAVAFSKEWEDETSEDAEAKSFYDGFFNVFGISRRRVASFEYSVRKADNKQGFVDLLWKGTILIEHKSRGKDLDKAFKQATDYFPGLKDSELPKYILVSDFQRFRLFDLDAGTEHEFPLSELVQNVQLFSFIAGYQKRTFKEEDPVNIAAAELMGELHDQLKEIGYTGHNLELYLVRLLFCLFADDTGIFEKGIFQEYLTNRTSPDGSDVAHHLATLFQVLNTPHTARLKNLDENLNAFPYVNGKLFAELIPTAGFDSAMRETLLKCCGLDWGQISPAIFGSLFQSVMNPKERRNLGAHYTSEKNILKVIKPLFLDELRQEFQAVRKDRNKLQAFHTKLAKLLFLDPACGCGNFLVIIYRELRLLELEVIQELLKGSQGLQQVTSVNDYVKVNVDQCYGIEVEEFPAQIAQVAMWLIDHQMNMRISEAFGEYYVRLPLVRSANITHGNALRIDWKSLSDSFDFIVGNPPFIGSKMMTQEQRDEIKGLFAGNDGAGVLDYVTGWYALASRYIQSRATRAAFVSTNSIAQGEQVGILWKTLLNDYGIIINFAHRTFKWSNEARGVAAVYCVIIGFGKGEISEKRLFEYETVTSEPHEIAVRNINPYLIEGSNIIIQSRSISISDIPKIKFGNQPIDGGYLLFSDEEKDELLNKEPKAEKFIRRFVGSYEFINNVNRWCLWLNNAKPEEIRALPKVREILEQVKQFRLSSNRKVTRDLALTPSLFAFISHTESTYIIIPSVSSERRRYIPIGFMPPNVIASNLCLIIPDASLYHFGILTSEMHMTWVRYVCGRLKSDYRYSNSIVYNNFPFPEDLTEKQREAVEKAAQNVLDARAQFPDSSLADLYDPLTMPPALAKAHRELDKAVDQCYRPQPFPGEAKRIEFLFERYEKLTAGMFAEGKKKGKRSEVKG